MSRRPLRPATVAVHAPSVLPPIGAAGEQPHNPPLFQTASWELPDAAATDAVAEGAGYFYARYGAPNADAAAAAVAQLEGAEAGLCFASGMAALSALLSTWLGPGGRLVTVRGIYGGTFGLVKQLAARQGFDVAWAEAPRPEAVAPLLDGGADLVHVETISNPLLRVADLDGLGRLCQARGVPLCVDATFATPVLSRPIARGAALVMHSATKYLGGHGDLSAGVVVGARAAVERLRAAVRIHGAALDPFAAWLLQRGLRTLFLRVRRQVDSAGRIAATLAAHPAVRRVHYPGLPSHPDHPLAVAQLEGPGAMVAFEVADAAMARRVYDRLGLIRRMASLGDVESMLLHPASTSHRPMTPEERALAGISDGLLRLSVGIEEPEDLIDDLLDALG